LYNEKEEKREKGENEDDEERKKKFQLIGPFSQLYNIVVYIYSLTRQIKVFLKIAKRIISLDNHTR
jgi:hypothetical protein